MLHRAQNRTPNIYISGNYSEKGCFINKKVTVFAAVDLRNIRCHAATRNRWTPLECYFAYMDGGGRRLRENRKIASWKMM